MTLWTVVGQASLFVGFSRQPYWSGLPFPPPGDLPDPGIEPVFPAPPALAGRFLYHWVTWDAQGVRTQENGAWLRSQQVEAHPNQVPCGSEAICAPKSRNPGRHPGGVVIRSWRQLMGGGAGESMWRGEPGPQAPSATLGGYLWLGRVLLRALQPLLVPAKPHLV